MDIQKISDFLNKHESHTLTIERKDSSDSPGIIVEVGKSTFRSIEYILGIPNTHITALYCCGEVCQD